MYSMVSQGYSVLLLLSLLLLSNRIWGVGGGHSQCGFSHAIQTAESLQLAIHLRKLRSFVKKEEGGASPPG